MGEKQKNRKIKQIEILKTVGQMNEKNAANDLQKPSTHKKYIKYFPCLSKANGRSFSLVLKKNSSSSVKSPL